MIYLYIFMNIKQMDSKFHNAYIYLAQFSFKVDFALILMFFFLFPASQTSLIIEIKKKYFINSRMRKHIEFKVVESISLYLINILKFSQLIVNVWYETIWISLTKISSNSVGSLVLYWPNIDNMDLTLLSFWNYMLVN